jgi:hypothetical protein
MIATGRLSRHFAIDQALQHGREFGKPMVIFEALRCGYQGARRRGRISGRADHLARSVTTSAPIDAMIPITDHCRAGLRLLEKHIRDTREHVYCLDEPESGRTQDPVWNEAQGPLVQEGRIHDYLRMRWVTKYSNGRVLLTKRR